MTQLTIRQEQVFDLIKQYIADSGYPPTRADIAREFGFKSPNAAEEHLRALQKKGVIEIIPSTSRGIRINGQSGVPIFTLNAPDAAGRAVQIGSCDINPRFFKLKTDYLIQLAQQSFSDLNISKGDLLAIQKSTKASNNELIVGDLDNTRRVGVLKKTRSKYMLRLSTGDAKKPEIEINLKQQEWKIKGKVIGSLRDGI